MPRVVTGDRVFCHVEMALSELIADVSDQTDQVSSFIFRNMLLLFACW